jgi:uncharacterized protein YjbI with pentapeptide repeats
VEAKGPERSRLAREVWERLGRGQSLDPLDLGTRNGLVDLRGLAAPSAVPTGRVFGLSGVEVAEARGVPWLKDVRLEGIDFSEAGLAGLRLERCWVVGCRFDDALAENWAMWGTRFVDCTFRRARMRGSQLGAMAKRRPLDLFRKDIDTAWRKVDFSEADLRACHAGAHFEDCDFSNAKLEKFDFGDSSLHRCRFAGDLEEVEFAAAGWRDGADPVETLWDVDFRAARLRWVAFRRLNLDHVQLPDGDDHLILGRFPCVLERALELLRDATEPASLALRGLLEWDKEWLGPCQEVGVIHLSMLENPAAAVPFLRAIEAECLASNEAGET